MSSLSSLPLFIFLHQPVDKVLMAVREEPLLEFHCKQMDHFVGLQFSQNFHFALMVHLVKGMSLFLWVFFPTTSHPWLSFVSGRIGFRIMTSPGGISGYLHHVSFSEVSDHRWCLKFRLRSGLLNSLVLFSLQECIIPRPPHPHEPFASWTWCIT